MSNACNFGTLESALQFVIHSLNEELSDVFKTAGVQALVLLITLLAKILNLRDKLAEGDLWARINTQTIKLTQIHGMNCQLNNADASSR